VSVDLSASLPLMHEPGILLTQPAELYASVMAGQRKVASGVAKVFHENMKGPVERIAAALFEKPNTPVLVSPTSVFGAGGSR
jgi:hypothetical protein